MSSAPLGKKPVVPGSLPVREISDVSVKSSPPRPPPKVKLGKREAVKDTHTVKLHDFLKFPEPPPSVDYHLKYTTDPAVPGGKWQLLDNDKVGDCGPVSAAHALSILTANAEAATYIPTQEQVNFDYKALSGWNGVIDDPSDGGVVLLELMKRWRKVGMCEKQIFGFASLNPRDHMMFESAIQIFGCVILGVQLPAAVQGANEWRAPARHHVLRDWMWEPGSWGGHAVVVGKYNPLGLPPISWGAEVFMDWAFLDEYADEAYVVLSPEWINDTTLRTPTGLDKEGLIKAISAFGPVPAQT